MPDPLVTGTIIQEGSGLLSSAMNNIWAQAQQAGQREYTYQMTDYLYSKDLEQWNRQNAYNLEMWNMQNQYNSPDAQMQRYKDAGLNPNLIYGQGQPGLSSPVPQAPGPQAKGNPAEMAKIFPLQKMDFVSTLLGIQMQEQQLQNMEATRQQTLAQTDVTKAQAIIEGIKAGATPKQIQFLLDQQDFERSKWPNELAASNLKEAQVMAEITKNIQSSNLTIKQKELLEKELEFMSRTGIQMGKTPFWLQWMLNLGIEDFNVK